MHKTIQMIHNKIFQSAGRIDIFFLGAFIFLITLHPYFMWGEIKLSEMGLYLPGAQVILEGKIPFRDIFHLRGPLELYMIAGMLHIFGSNLMVLNLYFYAGTVITLFLGVLVAKELYRTRYVLYLMTLVFVARTFPRIFYKDWGGIRYGWGLAAMLCAIRFFKQGQLKQIFFAGIFTACGSLTSAEIGILAAIGICSGLFFAFIHKLYAPRFLLKAFSVYLAAVGIIIVPYFIYLSQRGALLPYLDVQWSIMSDFGHTFDQSSVEYYPANFLELVLSIFNPTKSNFSRLTPIYLYFFLLFYIISRIRSRRVEKIDANLICLGLYGFLSYATSFRSIHGPQFETALQPEKILLFFLLEKAFFFLLEMKQIYLRELNGSYALRKNVFPSVLRLYGIVFCFSALFLSSVCYSLERYNKRFFAFKFIKNFVTGKDTSSLKPFSEDSSRTLSFMRLQGLRVPIQQAEELEEIFKIVEQNTSSTDVVMAFPESGIYNFFLNRPFLGRFPSINLTWFNDRWHQEIMTEFKKNPPKCIIVPQKLAAFQEDVFFKKSEANKKKYNEMLALINERYVLFAKTSRSLIYFLKTLT